jgi:hypothetical protein
LILSSASASSATKNVSEIVTKLCFKAPVTIVESNELNAWSVESGEIFITRRMFDFCQTDDELAAVIAFERGHYQCCHFVQQAIARQTLMMSLGSVARTGTQDMGTIVKVGEIVSAVIPVFNKKQVYEADAWGYSALRKSGYDQEAMPKLYARLRDEVGNGGGLQKYISSHPPLNDRIAELKKRGALLLIYSDLTPKVVQVDPKPFLGLTDGVPMPGFQMQKVGPEKQGVYLIYQSTTPLECKHKKLTLPAGIEEVVVLMWPYKTNKRSIESASLFMGESYLFFDTKNHEPMAIRIPISELVKVSKLGYQIEYKNITFSAKAVNSDIFLTQSPTDPNVPKCVRPTVYNATGKMKIFTP